MGYVCVDVPVYGQPDRQDAFDDIALGHAKFSKKGLCLFVGDFNSRMKANGDTVYDQAGVQLARECKRAEGNDLCVVNLLPCANGEFTHWVLLMALAHHRLHWIMCCFLKSTCLTYAALTFLRVLSISSFSHPTITQSLALCAGREGAPQHEN